ncbi:hypothetical protein SAMN05660445_01342, partial [Salegentibacter salarius]
KLGCEFSSCHNTVKLRLFLNLTYCPNFWGMITFDDWYEDYPHNKEEN